MRPATIQGYEAATGHTPTPYADRIKRRLPYMGRPKAFVLPQTDDPVGRLIADLQLERRKQ